MAENQDQLYYEINFVLAQQSISNLKIQIDEVSKTFADVALDSFTKSTKEADKATRDFVDSAKESAKILATEKAETKDTAQALIDKKKALSDLNKDIKANGGATAENVLQQTKLKAEISALNSELTKQAKEITTIERVGVTWANTYEGLAERNKALSIAMKSLPLDDTTGELKKLQTEYNANNDKLKEFDASIGNNQRNVGNYKSALGGIVDKFQVFGVSLGDVKKGFRDAIGENEKLTFSLFVTEKGLKAVGMAFKGIGIGLVVAIVVKLIEQMMKLQPVISLIDKTMAILDATFRVMAERVFFLGSSLVKFFQGDFKGAINDSKSAFNNLGGAIVNAVEKSEKSADLMKKYEKAVIDSTVAQAKLRASIEKTKLSVEEENISNAEKLKRIDEVLSLERKYANENIRLQQLRVDAQQASSDAATDNYQEEKNLQDEKAKLFELEQERDSRLKEITTKRTGLIKTETDKQKKIYEDLANSLKVKDEQGELQVAEINEDLLKKDLDFANDIIKQNVANFEAGEKAKSEIAQREAQLRRNLETMGVALALDSLKTIFGNSKALAIASALNNTYQAVTRTLAEYPVPFNFGLAGLVATAGLKQVNDIRKSKMGGGGGTVSAPSSSGGSVTASRPSFTLPTSSNSIQGNPSMNTGNQNITLNVENKLDRTGLAIAVREGNLALNSAGISVNSL